MISSNFGDPRTQTSTIGSRVTIPPTQKRCVDCSENFQTFCVIYDNWESIFGSHNSRIFLLRIEFKDRVEKFQKGSKNSNWRWSKRTLRCTWWRYKKKKNFSKGTSFKEVKKRCWLQNFSFSVRISRPKPLNNTYKCSILLFILPLLTSFHCPSPKKYLQFLQYS